MSTLVNLINTLRKNINESDRNEHLAEQTQAHLATAIAMSLAIPAEGGSATTIYNTRYNQLVRKLVCEVNEFYLLDVDCVLKLVEKNYIARFNFVHAPEQSLDAVNALATHIAGGNAPFELTVSELKRISVGVVPALQELQGY